jgi:polyisoprenoid-binding protein YceI
LLFFLFLRIAQITSNPKTMNKQLFVAVLYIILATSCRNESDAPKATITEAEAPKPVTPAAIKYVVDTISSNINWIGTKPTGKHTGTIKLSNGEIFVKNGMAETGSFTIDMKSITVTDPKEGKNKTNLENHLKGLGDKANEDHFFNTGKYPTGTFEITGMTTVNNKTIVEGNLTLKGIIKNIQFPAMVSVNDSITILNSESFKINRILWNINYNSKSAVENLGNQYIDDDIELKVSVTARRQ